MNAWLLPALFHVGQQVTLLYGSWVRSEGTWDVNAEIAACDTVHNCYTLKILDVWDLDSVDRDALEGLDKNLYGWVPSGAIRAR